MSLVNGTVFLALFGIYLDAVHSLEGYWRCADAGGLTLAELTFCCTYDTSCKLYITLVALHTDLPFAFPFLCKVVFPATVSTLRLLTGSALVRLRRSLLPVEVYTFQESVVWLLLLLWQSNLQEAVYKWTKYIKECGKKVVFMKTVLNS